MEGLTNVEGALEGADDILEGVGGAAVGFVSGTFGLDVAEGAIAVRGFGAVAEIVAQPVTAKGHQFIQTQHLPQLRGAVS